jgi:YfiH family protein
MTVAARRLDETPVPGAVLRLELADWRERYGVVAGITARGNGFDLGLHSPEPVAEVLDRWHRLFADLRPGFSGFVVARQVHGTRVAVHDSPIGGWLLQDGVDGHVTVVPGTLVLVTVADCVPIYLLHPDSGTVGLLHAGWRGAAGGILEAGIRTLGSVSGAAPQDVVMHCGVSICGSCYEVGPEVHLAVTGKRTDRPAAIDLRSALVRRAGRLGVRVVTQSPWCAAHEPGRFFSHRRSGGSDGRMAAYLGVPVA